ncbi:MAG TPA: hypothetical protein VGT24_01740 [Candidatus Acidoferrales bacterium]|nr:hypothetical protein [Candidatus Acidoferrales bacterium]
MPIRIQIVTEKWNPISAAIRFSTRSWASHAEFIDIAAGITLGARSVGGVKYRLCEKDHYSRIEQFVVDKASDMVAAWSWAATQVGKPYDFSAISGIALDRNWHDESKWFCSELVAVAFEKAGHPLLSTRPSAASYRITPRDLLLSRELFYLG